MTTCTKCGGPMLDGATVCGHCGAKCRFATVAEMVTELSDDPAFTRRVTARLEQPVQFQYLGLRHGEVARTEEVSPGECYADFDSEGRLLGVEVIFPALPEGE